MTIEIVAELPEHQDAIERVLDRAFGPGRFAKTSERVRERAGAAAPLLSRVAIEDGAVIGVCRISRISVGATDAFFLGPLAVDPSSQHQGLGATLTRNALAACRADRVAGAVILVGAEAFFKAFGFSIIPEHRVEMLGPVDPRRFLWLELRPGGFDGVSGAINRPRAASPA